MIKIIKLAGELRRVKPLPVDQVKLNQAETKYFLMIDFKLVYSNGLFIFM